MIVNPTYESRHQCFRIVWGMWRGRLWSGDNDVEGC